MLLQKVWKSIWDHNKIIRLLAWITGMGHFFSLFNNRARNQLSLHNNEAASSLKFIPSQDSTGQFGNPWSQRLLEFIAKHKPPLLWSRPCLMAKVTQRQIQAPSSSYSRRDWQPTWGFQGTRRPCPTEELFIREPSIPINVMIMAQFPFGSLRFSSSSVKMSLLDPLLKRRTQKTLSRKNREQNL